MIVVRLVTTPFGIAFTVPVFATTAVYAGSNPVLYATLYTPFANPVKL